jgi:hypothetical protein
MCLIDLKKHEQGEGNGVLSSWRHAASHRSQELRSRHLVLDADGAEIESLEVLEVGDKVYVTARDITRVRMPSRAAIAKFPGVTIDEESTREHKVAHLYNARFNAPNVYEVKVDRQALAEANHIFESVRPAVEHFMSGGSGRYKQLEAIPGNPLRFFGVNRHGWSSDVAWISVDDPATYNRFEALYSKLGLDQTFRGIVDHAAELRLYSAFFVVRKTCKEANMHVDYWPGVGTNALTFMTPLEEYETTNGFSLLYRRGKNETTGEVMRYRYQKRVGIVFGSRFVHSTEPGSSDRPQVYLCMQFGSDRQEHWPAILETISYQSRFVMAADGLMRPTSLGVACGEEHKDCLRRLVSTP